ncbi:MAG: hypothetical protein ACE149_12800 [Armatimonadota bacterium]
MAALRRGGGGASGRIADDGEGDGIGRPAAGWGRSGVAGSGWLLVLSSPFAAVAFLSGCSGGTVAARAGGLGLLGGGEAALRAPHSRVSAIPDPTTMMSAPTAVSLGVWTRLSFIRFLPCQTIMPLRASSASGCR